MSIPGGNVKNRQPPMQREGVGGNIKAANRVMNFFQPCQVCYAIDGDEDMFFRSTVMRGVSWMLSGVTKDSTGAVLGSCMVELFYTDTDQPISKVVSDASTGAFSFLIGPNKTYYLVCYKTGSPDVAGTSVNTLVPVAT